MNYEPPEEVSKTEITAAVAKLNRSRVSGPYGTPIEVVQLMTHEKLKVLGKIFNTIIRTATFLPILEKCKIVFN